jgi:ferritin-like metal-binding protein YciE
MSRKALSSPSSSALEGLGEDTSTLKDAAGKLMATAQSLSGVFAGDEVMKGPRRATFEHMKIASYKMLIAAATAAGRRRSRASAKKTCARKKGDGQIAQRQLARHRRNASSEIRVR